MLNVSSGGSTGGIGGKFSDKDLLESAKKYSYKWEWKRAEPERYRASRRRRNGLFEQCTEHMPDRAPNANPRPATTPDSRQAFKEAAAKRKADPEWRRKNAEHIAAIAAARRGTKVSEETRERMRIAARNRKDRAIAADAA